MRPGRGAAAGLLAAGLLGGAALLGAGPAAVSAPGPGWRPVFVDDFSGAELGPGWSAYRGRPSSDPRASWDPGEVAVRDGTLRLSGRPDPTEPGRWRTGGVSNWREARCYGRWDVRLRAHPDPTLSLHALLWPAGEAWPPEVDLLEVTSADRQRGEAAVHWRDASGERRRAQFPVRGDLSRWTELSLRWTPGELRLLIDGAEVFRLTGDAVPREPLWLALQAETLTASGAPGASGGGLAAEIDRVRIWAAPGEPGCPEPPSQPEPSTQPVGPVSTSP